MSLTQRNAFTEYDVRSAYYSGTATLKSGEVLAFVNTATTTDADPRLRLGVQVTDPAAANLKLFAGIVAPDSDGVTGPCYVSLIVPKRNQIVPAFTKINATALTTALGLVAAQRQLGAFVDATTNEGLVAIAAETADTSVTAAVKAVKAL
jgi:hypothetical protein